MIRFEVWPRAENEEEKTLALPFADIISDFRDVEFGACCDPADVSDGLSSSVFQLILRNISG